MKFGHKVFELCEWTEKQMHRQTNYNTLQP